MEEPGIFKSEGLRPGSGGVFFGWHALRSYRLMAQRPCRTVNSKASTKARMRVLQLDDAHPNAN